MSCAAPRNAASRWHSARTASRKGKHRLLVRPSPSACRAVACASENRAALPAGLEPAIFAFGRQRPIRMTIGAEPGVLPGVLPALAEGFEPSQRGLTVRCPAIRLREIGGEVRLDHGARDA